MIPSFFQFIKYKIHIGHSYKNTRVLSSWLLYRLQANVWIIDVFKTILFIKNIISFLKYLISYNFPIWFINIEITKEFLFLNYSRLCGEFACTRYWIRGMLSNYLSVSKSIRKYGSKKMAYKSSVFLKIINSWHITRYAWPRAIFLTNIDNNYIICNEAISMFLPIIAILDSNAKSYLVKFPLISNDDSIESFCFILNIISKIILLLKYKKLVLWFSKYKKIVKEINLKGLINYLHFSKKNNLKKVFYPLNFFNLFSFSLNKIKLYYQNNYNYNIFFSNKKLIFFDLKFIRKNLYFKKYQKISAYKNIFMFENFFEINVSKNTKKILYTLISIRKKNKNIKYFNYYNIFFKKIIMKYFALYWTYFIYSIKNLRVIYNTFIKKKNKQEDFFLNLKYLSIQSDDMENDIEIKGGLNYFPFFFIIKKKNSFYKMDLNKFYYLESFKSIINNKLFFNKLLYSKNFIELYYNKWFIYLLNASLN